MRIDFQDLPGDEGGEIEQMLNGAGCRLAHGRAPWLAASDDYDRYYEYTAGRFYQGSYDEDDYPTVMFDIKARRIILEGTAKAMVVEFEYPSLKMTWEPDDADGPGTFI